MTDNTIAIVGAGFGGLKAALTLSKGLKTHLLENRYSIKLINRDLVHLYTPLLYKYTAHPDLDIWGMVLPIENLIEGSNIELIKEEVREMDVEKGIISFTSDKELKAGYILLAPGSEINWFGIAGLAENSFPLKTLNDAREIKSRLNELPEGSQVLVAGGGPSGVELSAELALNRNMRISLIEAAPSILPGFEEKISSLAEKKLKELNVNIIKGEAIASVTKDLATTKNNKEIGFDILIWVGGVQVPDWIRSLPLNKEQRGRIETDLTMACSSSPALKIGPSIYAIGDSACVHYPDGKPMPPMARPAIEEAKVAGQNILIDILRAEGLDKDQKHISYKPVHYPYVVPIGEKYAVGKIGGVVLQGWIAWIFKELITFYYLLSVQGPQKAWRTWKKGL